MKVIDLLNDMVNGKTHYDYIEYYNRNQKNYNVMYVCKENILYKLNNEDIFLEDEIKQYKEELQEHKIDKLKIEKIYNRKYLCDDVTIDFLKADIIGISTKVNEIIDKLSEMEK